ncbi:MAG: lasso peptide biosynthesis B2 protein [Limisphaerales bacterium]
MLWLRKLRSFRSLPASERRCYFSALLLLPLVDIGLRLSAWQRCQQSAERWAKAGPVAGRHYPPPRRIAWLVERAARHCPWPATCLRRSLLLWAFLLRSGVASELRLGFRNADGKFEAHAWVELDGVPLNDAPDVRSRYAVPEQPLTALGTNPPAARKLG